MIVAIDGPAGSGKSTTARGVAQRLGFYLLDSGAMYRAVALAFIRRDVVPAAKEVDRVLNSASLVIHCTMAEPRIVLDGEDITSELRTPDVARMASVVAAFPSVRTRMVARQRELGDRYRDDPGLVIEGRDIGTVVYPNADVKFYMTAPARVRAQRRLAELQASKGSVELAHVLSEIKARDQRDKTRDYSPLMRADDAHEIDTANRTIEEQLDYIEGIIRKHISS